MAENNGKACFSCKFYTKAYGEKGYCKLYRHETALPDTACPKHEQKEEPVKRTEYVPKKTDNTSLDFVSLLTAGAFFACTVLAIVGFLVILMYIYTVAPVSGITTAFKCLTIVAGLLAILLFVYILFKLAKKYMWARIAEMILAVIMVIVLLYDKGTLVYESQNVLIAVVEKMANLF